MGRHTETSLPTAKTHRRDCVFIGVHQSVVVGDPAHAGDDVGQVPASLAVQDPDAVKRGSRRDAVVGAQGGAGAVRAVTVAVGGVGVLVHEIESNACASSELGVVSIDARVDDVDVNSVAGVGVGVHPVERRGALVDAIETPEPGIDLARRGGGGEGRGGSGSGLKGVVDVVDIIIVEIRTGG